MNLAEAPSNTHNKRCHTSHVCHRRRAAGRNQQMIGYKDTSTHRHTYTHTEREREIERDRERDRER